LGLSAFVVISLLPQNASALTYWGNRNGSTSFFDWKDGNSANGLFGDPIVTDAHGKATFLFYPPAFTAEATGGNQVMADTMKVELTATGTHKFTAIRITEYGEYAIDGVGEARVEAREYITRLDGVSAPINVPLTITPASPITVGHAFWAGNVNSVIQNWGHIIVQLNNTLTAAPSGPSDHVLIRKTCATVEVWYPEPATLTLLALGLVCLRRR